jgi:hypothetical protein
MSLPDHELRHALELLEAAVARQGTRFKEAIAAGASAGHVAAARDNLHRLQQEADRLRGLLVRNTP